jgi:integrase
MKLTKFFKQARVVHEKIEPLTAAEVFLFLKATRNRDLKKRKGDPEYCPFFLCAIHTGMRAGELAGLQCGDVDWNGNFLMVRRSVKKGKAYPTKTDKIRRVDMSDDLAAYRRRRLEEAMSAGRNEIPAWVFAPGEWTPIDMHNVSRREFPNYLAKAQLRTIRFHDLRHTLASLLIQNSESLAYVKEQLGHSSIKITVDIYGRLVPGANRQAANRLPSLSYAAAVSEIASRGDRA